MTSETEMQPEPTVRPTQYTVSVLPENHIDYHDFAIQIEARADDKWAILHLGRAVGRDGEWSYQPHGTDRNAARWLNDHRFDLDEALQLAREAAPHVTVNGRTAADVLNSRDGDDITLVEIVPGGPNVPVTVMVEHNEAHADDGG